MQELENPRQSFVVSKRFVKRWAKNVGRALPGWLTIEDDFREKEEA
jgi:hypothetical protein